MCHLEKVFFLFLGNPSTPPFSPSLRFQSHWWHIITVFSTTSNKECLFLWISYLHLIFTFLQFSHPRHASPALRKTLNVDYFATKITVGFANINKFIAREQCPIYFPIVFGSFKPSQTMTFLILGCFNLKLLRIACSLFIVHWHPRPIFWMLRNQSLECSAWKDFWLKALN